MRRCRRVRRDRRIFRCRLAVGVCVAVLLWLVTQMGVSPAAASSPTFPDVLSSHPYYAAITDLASRGIISGYTNGNFGPGDPILRQEFAKMIVKTMGIAVDGTEVCPFSDVVVQSGDDPFFPSKYVAACAAWKITQGKTVTTFAPYANITRAQLLSMVVRAAAKCAPGSLRAVPEGWKGQLSYSDPAHGSNLKKAEYNGLLAGIQSLAGWNTYRSATRGEVAQVLSNLIQLRERWAAGDITRYGVDYSMTKVDWPAFFEALKASGRDFIGRYLPWRGALWRQVTTAELEAAAEAGVDYFFWFEDSDNHYSARDGGFDGGVADAQEALRALERLGLPTTTPVYYTVDFPASDGSQIDAYFRGINSVVPVSQIGAYGNYKTIDWLYRYGLATYFCQSDAWGLPQGWHPQACMHQQVGGRIGGVSVDRLTVTGADFGQCRRREEFDPRLYYSGSWITSSAPAGVHSGGAAKCSSVAHASVTVSFHGTSIDWLATLSPEGGSARISLDGAEVATIDLYSAIPQYQQIVWSSGPLAGGPHVLTIRQDAGTVNIDAFDVVGSVLQNARP